MVCISGTILMHKSGWGVMRVARVWHAVWRRPAGAAAAFLLAAVAGVVGNQLTGHLTVALVAFIGLLTAGMAVVFLLEWRAGEHTSNDDQGAATDGEPGCEAYGLRGVQGIQVGDGNQQTNYFGGSPQLGHRE
jgi:hypothetical protein